MAIPVNAQQSGTFSVPNKFPKLPQLNSIKPEDMVRLETWWENHQVALTRTFSQLQIVLDSKADKP